MEAVRFSNCISVLLLEDAEGWTPVDTGVGLSPECIRKALATLGATPEALKRVYLIHHYPDHVGCLPGVQQRASNVEVVASEHEAEIISGKRGRDLPSNTLLRYLSRYQKLLRAPVDRGGARGRARRGELSRDRYTGAHSWAHLAFAGRGWALFYQRRVRGSATQDTVGVYKAPCTDPPQAKRSAEKLLAEEFDVVVRSHGEPLYGGVQAATGSGRPLQLRRTVRRTLANAS